MPPEYLHQRRAHWEKPPTLSALNVVTVFVPVMRLKRTGAHRLFDSLATPSYIATYKTDDIGSGTLKLESDDGEE